MFTRLRSLFLVSLLLVLATVGIFIRYRLLKAKAGQVIAPQYVFDADSLATIARQENPDVIIVNNPQVGSLDRQNKPKLEIKIDLTLAPSEEEPEKEFYRIIDIKADADGNIYVCEWFDAQIKKFDSNGKYLLTMGKKGAGPGELVNPKTMAFDPAGNLCVFDYGNQRISKFSVSGVYLDSFPIKFLECNQAGFVIDDDGNFYSSCWDSETDKVIHKFNSTGNHIISFGEAVNFPKPLTSITFSSKKYIAGGWLAIYNTELYYTQINPYEIRKYSLDGQLKMRIFRKNDFMVPGEVTIKGKTTSFKLPPHCRDLFIWNGNIINIVEISRNPYPNSLWIIDIFNLAGELLRTFSVEKTPSFSYIDAHGNIYGTATDKDGFETVVRYRINLL